MARLDLVKIICIVVIGVGLLIPLAMIRGLVQERSKFRDAARADIARAWTGPQWLLGPVLSAPVKLAEGYGRIHKFPESLTIRATLHTEMRKRGLYSIPVYLTRLEIEGEFDTTGLDASEDVILSLAIADNRGIVQQPTLTWGDATSEFVPGSGLPQLANGIHARVPVFPGENEGRRSFSIELELRGMSSLEFAPVGRDTRVELHGVWPHPSFTGRFLPVQYSIENDQFDADWHVPHIASDAQQTLDELNAGRIERLRQGTFGVELFNPIDRYHQSMRAVKYGILFVILTFTAFFLVELTRDLRLHPIHYLLVGFGLTIFFLLLISLSEHVAFWIAYLLAALACIGQIAGYLVAVLGRVASGIRFGALLGGLYGMLYMILLSEDNALLMGSLLLFLALATVMYVTRRLDWYSIGDTRRPTTPLEPEA